MKADLLADLAVLLDTAGVVWWLSDGAALGCVRDGRFLASDGDVDVGVWADAEPTVARLLDAAGWHRTAALDPAWTKYGEKLDVHGHRQDGDQVWFPLAQGRYRYVFSADLFDRFEIHLFCGVHVRVPAPSDRYLTQHYGPDWQTPRASWSWRSDPPCLEVVDSV